MNRIINSLLKLLIGKSLVDDLHRGESTLLPEGRFDKNGRTYTYSISIRRDS